MAHDRVTAADERSRSSILWAISALLLFGATLAMRFPGIAMYDSVAQYEQALDGSYTDWHPPILAHSWALLNRLQSGTALFFLIQMLLWWGGIGLLAAALGRRQRDGAAALVLLAGIAPLWLGWATVVLKDAQLACCLIGATGLVAHWRLERRRMPRWAVALAVVLIAYATLVRANAAFATIPFALALIDRPRLSRLWHELAAAVVLIGAVMILNPIVNAHVFHAERTGVENALPLYDLAGVAHRAHLAAPPGLAPAGWALAEQRRCYTPFFWNPYGQDSQCGFVGQAIAFDTLDDRRMLQAWLGVVARHPLAYAAHRLAHLNANLRLWVDANEPEAVPPVASEPNPDHLGARPNASGQALIAAARLMAVSPLGWPAAWLVLAGGLLWASRGVADPQVGLGRALACSAACMSGSFAVISIASDLRYHLWSMIAAALALIMITDTRLVDRRRSMVAASLVVAVVAIGTVARLGLAAPVYVPLPPASPSPSTTAR